jgi:hypothetical protein
MAKLKKYKFKRTKLQVFTIVDENKKEIGSLRVEPGEVGWMVAGTTEWYKLSIEDFAKLAVGRGRKGEAPLE